jgi:hypothetical protein
MSTYLSNILNYQSNFSKLLALFSDIYAYIKIQNKTFNKKRYLESQKEIDRPFYEQVLLISMDMHI